MLQEINLLFILEVVSQGDWSAVENLVSLYVMFYPRRCYETSTTSNRLLFPWLWWTGMLRFCSLPAHDRHSEGFPESRTAWNPDVWRSVVLPRQLGLKSRSLFQRRAAQEIIKQQDLFPALLLQTEVGSWTNKRSSTVRLLQNPCLAEWPLIRVPALIWTHQHSETPELEFTFRFLSSFLHRTRSY